MTKLGFTLIELLVVITIIGMLATVSVIALNPTEITRKARDSRRISDLTQLKQAIDLSLAENGDILGDFGSSDIGSRVSDGSGYIKIDIIKNMPLLPIPGKNGQTISNSNGNSTIDAYYFQAVAGTLRYELKTTFESNIFQNKLVTDGGNESEYYEIGSDLTFTLPE
jgi:prepilin-type N-terminal cleavage/methylation domain-containing protein